MAIGRKFKNERNSSRSRVEYANGKNHEHKCENQQFVPGTCYTRPDGISHEDFMEDLIEELDMPSTIRAGLLGRDSGLCHMHYMVSLPEGETLSMTQWGEALKIFMEELGYDADYKYCGNIHNDTGKQHMHILANRTSMDTGYLLNEGNDFEKIMEACRKIEQKFGLTVVANPEETWGVELTEREIRQSLESDNPELHWKHQMIARIATAVERTQAKGGDMIDLVRALKKAEVGVEFTVKENKIIGISYEFKDKKISGRNLKRSRCTFQALCDREGIRFSESLVPALSRIAKIRDGKSAAAEREEKYIGDRKKIDPRLEYELSHAASLRPTLVRNQKYFAIAVNADNFRRQLVTKHLTPTRTIGKTMYFSFTKPTFKSVSDDIEIRKMLEFMRGMMEMIQALLGGIRCDISLQHDFYPSVEDGPRYRLSTKKDVCAQKKPEDIELTM